jgi:hypothetical protein
MAKKGESLNISPEKIIVKKLRDIFYELSNLDAELLCRQIPCRKNYCRLTQISLVSNLSFFV